MTGRKLLKNEWKRGDTSWGGIMRFIFAILSILYYAKLLKNIIIIYKTNDYLIIWVLINAILGDDMR